MKGTQMTLIGMIEDDFISENLIKSYKSACYSSGEYGTLMTLIIMIEDDFISENLIKS